MSSTAVVLADLFAGYRSWYREHWMPKLLADLGEEEADLVEFGWHDPIAGLRPATGDEIAALADRFGPLPASYLDFLRTVGTGGLLLPTGRWQDYALEPTELIFTRPADVPEAHVAFRSWLHEEWYEANAGIDLSRMMPIMGVDVNFVLLSLQHPGDDRVNVWRHDAEPFRLDSDTRLVDLLDQVIESGKREQGLPFRL